MSFRFAVHVMSHKINHEFHSILFECKFWRKHLFVSRLLLLCTQLIVIFLYTWDTQLQVFWGVGFLIFKNCQFILGFLFFFWLFGFFGFFVFFFFCNFHTCIVCTCNASCIFSLGYNLNLPTIKGNTMLIELMLLTAQRAAREIIWTPVYKCTLIRGTWRRNL